MISAVIITLNEADNIERCIRSLTGVADEIVVADSGSEDGTIEIAGKLGARVLQVEWEGFATTKNKANQAAQFDYILSLDADEELSEQLREAILSAKSKLSGAYSMNRLNNYCGKWIKHGGFYPDRKARLFHRDQAQWTGGPVHETLVVNVGVKVTHLTGDLLHYSYSDLQKHEQRLERYAKLGAEKVKHQKGLRWKALFNPAWRFVRNYVLLGGFLDGKAGYHLSRLTAKEVRLKYKYARGFHAESQSR